MTDPAVLRPTSLAEALRLRAEHLEAVPIHGGTDLMVAVNFRHHAPTAYLDLTAVRELSGWTRDAAGFRIGAGTTHTELMAAGIHDGASSLADAARTVGSPQIRNRGTIGGNVATASPAGDTLPPLRALGAQVELTSGRRVRTLDLGEFVVAPKRTVLEPDELITAILVPACAGPQVFMKIGQRNAMVISVASLAVVVDQRAGVVRAAFGSAGPVIGVVEVPLDSSATLPQAVAEACSPIDDVRGSATYRRHALKVLTQRALTRCAA